MKTPLPFLPLAIVMVFTPGCREKDAISAPKIECGYTIRITEKENTVATYGSDCKNNSITRKGNELRFVLSSADTKYVLAVSIKGAKEGVHTVKNEYPFEAGTSTLFLTTDQSAIPGPLSFSRGTLTVTRINDQVVDGVMNATAISAVNHKTYTLTGEFRNMSVQRH